MSDRRVDGESRSDVRPIAVVAVAIAALGVGIVTGVAFGRASVRTQAQIDAQLRELAERMESLNADHARHGSHLDELRRARAAGLAALADSARMTDPMHALLLAREAVRTAPTPWSVAALRRALLASHERAARKFADAPPTALAWIGDDVFVGADDGGVHRWRTGGGPAIERLAPHDSAVSAMLFAPRTGVLLTASNDGTAVLRALSGTADVRLRAPGAPIVAAAISPDESLVALGASDGTARIVGADGTERAVLSGHGLPVRSVAFSPDGSAVLTASMDATARVWSLDGTERAVLAGHGEAVLAAAWSPDGRIVATSSKDGTARLWSNAGEEIAVLRGHDGAVPSLAFAPDGASLATGGEDGALRLWSAAGEAELAVAVHTARVTSITFSRDGSRILTSSWDGTACVTGADGRILARFAPRGGWMDAAVFSPDERRVATCARDGTVRLFDVAPGETAALVGHEDAVRCVLFARDGLLLSGGEDGTLRAWDLPDGTQRWVTQCGAEGDAVVDLFLGSRLPASGTVTVARRDGKPICVFVEDGSMQPSVRPALVGSRGGVLTSSAAGLDATSTPDGDVTVRDVEGTVVSQFAIAPSRVAGVSLSPDGRFLATAHFDGVVRVWAVRAEDLLALADRRVTREFAEEERAAYADLLAPR